MSKFFKLFYSAETHTRVHTRTRTQSQRMSRSLLPRCSVHSCKLHVIPNSSGKTTKAEAGPTSQRPGHTITQGALDVPVWFLFFLCLSSSIFRWDLSSLI